MNDPKTIREQVVKDAKRRVILDAAHEIFSEKGFHETRLEDIAERAGFSKASLYNYYTDKVQIFLSLSIREYSHILDVIREEATRELHCTEKFRNILTSIYQHFGKNFGFIVTTSMFQTMSLLHCSGKDNDRLMKDFHKEMWEIVHIFAAIIAEGRRRGEITSSLDDSTLAQMLGSLIRGVIFMWKQQGKMGDIDRAVDEIIAFIETGFGIQHPPGSEGEYV
jgi:AcrR family transcriptional regulator